MDLFDLVAKITLETGEYEKNLEKAEKSASGFGEKLKKTFKVGTAAVATVTTATAAMTTALIKGTGQVAAYGDNIDKMSQKMGLSAEAYQEWDAIMQHSGTSMESLQAGMKTLANAVETGNKAFDRLGISQEEIAGMNNEQLFSATITALQNVENETERTYLAGQLLGRGATELGALLNTSAEDTEAMRKRVHQLGGVMSNEAVKAAAAYQDSLQDMKTAFSGLSRGLVSNFLPSITTVMDGLTELFAGNGEKGLSLISNGITNLVNNITEQLPAFVDVGVRILESISTAIIDNLPQLASAATSVILQIVQFLIQSAPAMLDAALEILDTLANGLIEALPTLIPALVDVIMTIVDKLTEPDTLVQLVEVSLQLMIALAEGLIKAIPQVISRIPTIIANIVKALLGGIPKVFQAGGQILASLGRGLLSGISSIGNWMGQIVGRIRDGLSGAIKGAVTWGRDLIGNFVGGIKEKWNNLKNTVSDVAGSIKSFLGFSEPEEGPLSNFHTYAPDMMKLFAQGIKDNEHLITDQIGKSFDFGNDIADMNMTGSGVASAGTNNTFGAVSINIYPQEGQDAQDIAEAVMLRIQEEYERKAAVFA